MTLVINVIFLYYKIVSCAAKVGVYFLEMQVGKG